MPYEGLPAPGTWVAKAFDFSSRGEKLSWNHHRHLAKLDPAERQHWLTRVTTPPAGTLSHMPIATWVPRR